MSNCMNLLVFSLICFSLFSCNSIKPKSNVLQKDVDFVFENHGFATTIEGQGKITVYEKTLYIEILHGSIQLNPDFDQSNYEIGSMNLGLATYVNEEKGVWADFNHGNIVSIYKEIDSPDSSISLAGLKFRIPYYTQEELDNSWIVVRVSNQKRSAWNYAHSKNKEQSF